MDTNNVDMDVKVPICADSLGNLPGDIIEQILTTTDPNGFASLALLNRKWHHVSQNGRLYVHQLAQCSSFAASHSTLPSADDDNLPTLRRLFARQVKRNLFDAFLRPRQTVIKLVSTSISSSSCPGGEGMQFSASPRSQLLLAYNSSRIYVIDVRGKTAEIKREFKILRRPVAVCVKDDASLLAVLSSEMQVDIYDLEASPPRRRQAIILDNTPRTIAISPCGSVLAAAYDGGIEVSSLNPGALASDKRSVKCDPVDSLCFSHDGTQILGTTIHSSPPSTVILTAPYYDPGSTQPGDGVSSMWTTSILFPNSSRDCSHAVLLQDGSQEEASWSFAYDRSFETFRAVRIDDLRNGTTYFPGPVPKTPSQAKLLPSTLSGATYHGELVAAGFHGKEIWVYGVPEDLDAVPEAASGSDRSSASTGLGRHNSDRSNISRNPSSRSRDPSDGRVPQWQLLCDRQRNTVVAGSKIAELSGVSNVKWVANFDKGALRERLIVTAKGVLGPRLVTEEEDFDFVDGGRIALLDFEYGVSDGETTETTIEVGTDEAETLEEEQRDMATEVAIVRRRTVAQRRGGRTAILRAATTANRESVPALPDGSTEEADDDDDDPLQPRKIGLNPVRNASTEDTPEDPDVATIEEQEAMDAPYAHGNPRSAPTLRRAATAAAVNSRLNPRLADGRPIEYQRADGRREHPHESDADNWVPPPPPYQKEDPGATPAFLRGPAVRPMNGSVPPVPPMPAIPRRAVPSALPGQAIPEEARSSENSGLRSPHQRTASDSTTLSRPRPDEGIRPRSSPSPQVDTEDIYDTTPPMSPVITDVQPRNEGSRRPSGSTVSHSVPSEPRTSLQTSGQLPPQPEQAAAMPSPTISSPHSDRPSLSLYVPPTAQPVAYPNSAPTQPPGMRRLSNSQTWPAGREDPNQMMGHAPGFPYSAPYQNMSSGDASLPPPPNSGQVASLNNRISQGHPRRLSGGFSGPNSAYGGYTAQASPPSHQPLQQPLHQPSHQPLHQPPNQPLHQPPHPQTWPVASQQQAPYLPVATQASVSQQSFFSQPGRPVTAGTTNTWNTIPDQPLIISTPKGVSGAFDPPERNGSRRSDMPIVAPVPRHPRNGHGANSRPTVERLETIYSVTPANQQRGKTRNTRGGLLAPFRRSPSVSPGIPVGVARQTSRAGRSAAKNMQDARKKGWDPKRSKSKSKKRKKKRKDYDKASSLGGWTDISTTSALKEQLKEKKCIVM